MTSLVEIGGLAAGAIALSGALYLLMAPKINKANREALKPIIKWQDKKDIEDKERDIKIADNKTNLDISNLSSDNQNERVLEALNNINDSINKLVDKFEETNKLSHNNKERLNIIDAKKDAQKESK